MSRLALSIYAAANRAGVLRTRLGDALFTRSYFAYKRFVEDPFAALLRTAPELFAGGDIIDVGANIGYTATVFANAVAGPFRVFAFEPQSENFDRLRRTIARLQLNGKVECIRAAVGDRNGEALLWNNEEHHGDHRIVTENFARRTGVEPVPITTLDSFIAARGGPAVAFVKIDVQGFEPAVIAGMREVMRVNRALSIAEEIAPQQLRELGFSIEEAMAPLLDEGFTPFLVSAGRLLPANVETVRTAAIAREYIDVVWRRA